jgi:hypothetical protein
MMAGIIRVVPFAVAHLAQLAVQPAQQRDWADSAERDARGAVFAMQEHAVSFIGAEGVPLACFGLVKSHEQHLSAWSVLSVLTRQQLLFATKWCRAYLDALTVRRIDMAVRAGFEAGNHWAGMLGFTQEGVQSAFFADGEDMHVWVRLRSMVI